MKQFRLPQAKKVRRGLAKVRRVPTKVRRSLTDLLRLVSTRNFRVSSVILAAVLGTLVEAITMGSIWIAVVGPGDLDHLADTARTGTAYGAMYGTFCGVSGVLLGACFPGPAEERKTASRIAAYLAAGGVAACLLMAAFTLAGLDIASGSIFVWLYLPVFCGVAAGVAIGFRDATATAEAAAETEAEAEATAETKVAAGE